MGPDSFPVRAARRAAFRLLHAWRPEHTVVARVSGVQIALGSRSPIAEELYANSFERLERGILGRLVGPGDAMLDVGSNVGFYACLFGKRVGTGGTVYAFEPAPDAFEGLVANLSRNALGAHVRPFQLAVAEREGSLTLNSFGPRDSVYNSLATAESYGKVAAGRIQVEAVTLDSFLKTHPLEGPVGIKIDVEGCERSVLDGGRSSLSSIPSLLLMVEINEELSRKAGVSASETVELLRSWGLKVFEVGRDGGLLELPPKTPLASRPGIARGNMFFLRGEFLARAAAAGLVRPPA